LIVLSHFVNLQKRKTMKIWNLNVKKFLSWENSHGIRNPIRYKSVKIRRNQLTFSI
jgi:hypothetical protein